MLKVRLSNSLWFTLKRYMRACSYETYGQHKLNHNRPTCGMDRSGPHKPNHNRATCGIPSYKQCHHCQTWPTSSSHTTCHASSRPAAPALRQIWPRSVCYVGPYSSLVVTQAPFKDPRKAESLAIQTQFTAHVYHKRFRNYNV